jgi:hypothetical protein
MGEHKKKGRVEKRGILLIKPNLGSEIIPGVIEGMNLIHPKGLMVKGVKSKGEADQDAKDNAKDLFSIRVFHSFSLVDHSISILIPFSSGDLGSQRRRYMETSVGNLFKWKKLPSKYPLKTQ